MRLSQFQELMNDEFGPGYAAVLLKDLALQGLADRTANQCIEQGEDPKEVWLAICAAEGVPKERWQGKVQKNKKSN